MTDHATALPTLATTGATGALGGAVARLLADAGRRQRLLVRDPARAPRLDGAVPVPLGLGSACASSDGATRNRAL